MTALNLSVPPRDLIRGREFVDALKDAAKVEKDSQLSNALGIPRNTISTWCSRNALNADALLRVAIHYNLDLRAFAMKGEVIRLDEDESRARFKIFTYKKIMDGVCTKESTLHFDAKAIDLDEKKCEVIEIKNCKFFVNLTKTDVEAGNYFIKIKHKYSIAKLQLLPADNVQMIFDDSSAVVPLTELNVLGRVEYTMIAK